MDTLFYSAEMQDFSDNKMITQEESELLLQNIGSDGGGKASTQPGSSTRKG